MAGRVGSDSDARDSVGSVVVDRFDHGKGGQVIGLVEELRMLLRRRVSILNANHILHKPFVDCFGRMRHEDSSSKVRFGEDIG